MKEKLAEELAKTIINNFKEEGVELQEKDIPSVIQSCREILNKKKQTGEVNNE